MSTEADRRRPTVAHQLMPMSGRDPHERGRTATPLELLFDLTLVVAFGVAGNEVAHYLAEGHVATAAIGFAFAMFAAIWAWINYSWFASAFDTDDWVYRLTTMVQMAGVIVLALGLPPVFESVDSGQPIDNGVAVLGYVIMRLAMVSQWLRASRQSTEHRSACSTYAASITAAQVGWIIMIFLPLDLSGTLALFTALLLVELAGPLIAERRRGGTPWHAHHIAERYGLLAIVALGEGVIGTVAAVGAVVEETGWSLDVALVTLAGVGVTFGMWWLYFAIPSAQALHRHRERSFFWGYGHILLFAAIAGTGAGLHVAAYYIAHEAHISAVATVLTVVVPVAAYVLMVFLLHDSLLRTVEGLHLALLLGMGVVLLASTLLAAAGVAVAVCLVVVAVAPFVGVAGYETVGHRQQRRTLEQD